MVNRENQCDGAATLQDGMACVGLYLHKAYLTEYPADLSDLTAKSVFGSPFAEAAERMAAYVADVRETRCGVMNLRGPRRIPYDNRLDRSVDDDDDLEPVDALTHWVARNSS